MNENESKTSQQLKRHFEEIERRVDYNTIQSYFLENFNLFWNKIAPQLNSKNIPVNDFEKMKNSFSFWIWYETRNLISEEIGTMVLKVFLTEDNYEYFTKDMDETVVIEIITKEQNEKRKLSSSELHIWYEENKIKPTSIHSPNITSFIKEEMNEEKYKQFYQEVASIIHRTISKHIIYKKFEFPLMLLTLTGSTIEEIKKMINEIENQNKIYEKALEKDKTIQETNTDSMVDKHIIVIDDTRKPNPSLKVLEVKTGIEKYYWKERISNDAGFLEKLREKLMSKIKQAKSKENTEFWQGVLTHWWPIIEKNIDSMKSARKQKLQENMDYTKTDRKIHKKGFGHNYEKPKNEG